MPPLSRSKSLDINKRETVRTQTFATLYSWTRPCYDNQVLNPRQTTFHFRSSVNW